MKKGDLSINTVVIAALAIFVLVVLIIVFNTQIRKGAFEYFNIQDDAASAAKGNKCVTILSAGTHKCVTGSCESTWMELSPSDPDAGWKDCGPTRVCCEKIN